MRITLYKTDYNDRKWYEFCNDFIGLNYEYDNFIKSNGSKNKLTKLEYECEEEQVKYYFIDEVHTDILEFSFNFNGVSYINMTN